MRCVTRKPPAMLIDASRMAQRAEHHRRRRRRPAHRQHAADDDDAADRVGDAHERRVQRRRHVPDHLPADDAGEREDGEVREERRRRDEAEREERDGDRARRRPPARRRCDCVFGWRDGDRRRCGRLGRRGRRLLLRRRPDDRAVVHDERVAHDLVVRGRCGSWRRRRDRRADTRGCCRRARSPSARAGSAGRCSR